MHELHVIFYGELHRRITWVSRRSRRHPTPTPTQLVLKQHTNKKTAQRARNMVSKTFEPTTNSLRVKSVNYAARCRNSWIFQHISYRFCNCYQLSTAANWSHSKCNGVIQEAVWLQRDSDRIVQQTEINMSDNSQQVINLMQYISFCLFQLHRGHSHIEINSSLKCNLKWRKIKINGYSNCNGQHYMSCAYSSFGSFTCFFSSLSSRSFNVLAIFGFNFN